MKDIHLVVTDAASSNLKTNEYLQHRYLWPLLSNCVPHQVVSTRVYFHVLYVRSLDTHHRPDANSTN